MYIHSSDPPPAPLFKRGVGVNFNHLPRRGDIEKLKKGCGSMVQGEVFLKGGREAGTFPI